MSELIDTTEMYLRTIYELIEEGVVPLRARIVERLGQSGPTVSQTVARMQRDGLLEVTAGRQIELSSVGYQRAEDVMRKHRLAERLLLDVIGLDWELVHEEACRWEHVISEEVERRLLKVLAEPQESPYGNPIPGLERIGGDSKKQFLDGVLPFSELADPEREVTVCLLQMSENAQASINLLHQMAQAELQPGAEVKLQTRKSGIQLQGPGGQVELTFDLADKFFGRLIAK